MRVRRWSRSECAGACAVRRPGAVRRDRQRRSACMATTNTLANKIAELRATCLFNGSCASASVHPPASPLHPITGLHPPSHASQAQVRAVFAPGALLAPNRCLHRHQQDEESDDDQGGMQIDPRMLAQLQARLQGASSGYVERYVLCARYLHTRRSTTQHGSAQFACQGPAPCQGPQEPPGTLSSLLHLLSH